MANPAWVQQTAGASSSGVSTLATTNFGSSVTTGNTIVAFVLNGSAFTTQLVPTDTGGNTYKLIVGNTQGALGYAVYYAQNVTGGAAFAVTGRSSSDVISVSAIEISGLATLGAIIDSFNTLKSSSAATLTVGLDKLRNPNDILLCGAAQNQQPNGYTAGSLGGSTAAHLQTSESAFWGDSQGTEVQVVSSIGTYTGAVTSSNTGATVSIIIALSNTAFPQLPNNYQFVKVGDGMSVSEKIR